MPRDGNPVSGVEPSSAARHPSWSRSAASAMHREELLSVMGMVPQEKGKLYRPPYYGLT